MKASPQNPRTDLDDYHDGLKEALRGRYAEALAKLIPFSDRHADHFMGWYVRGICHHATGQLADAAAAFTGCAALRPNMPWTRFSRGIVRLEQHRFDAAESDFTTALGLKPDWTAAVINRAIARQRLGRFAEAEKDLTTALDKPDAPARIHFIRAESAPRPATTPRSARRRRGIERKPADCDSWVTRGVWQISSSPAEALKDFDEALKVDPRSRDCAAEQSRRTGRKAESAGRGRSGAGSIVEAVPRICRGPRRGALSRPCRRYQSAPDDAAACLRDEPSAYRYYQMASLTLTFPKRRRRQDQGTRRSGLSALCFLLYLALPT